MLKLGCDHILCQMESELLRYEQLANPNPGKTVKTKTVPIAQTLSDLAQFLRDERDRLVNQPEAPPLAIQQTFQTALVNIEASKAQIEERLKETHASGTKIGKLIDKVCLFSF